MIAYELIYVAIIGLCVGSFIGLVADRLPVGRSLNWERSRCPDCDHVLALRDLLPVAGWLLNRGRCRFCGGSIGFRYPLIEMAAGAIAVWSFAVLPGWLAWASCGLGWTLLTMSLIDARHFYLPNRLTLPLIPAGLAVAWAVDPDKLLGHGVGAVAGYTLVLVLAETYRRLRGREGIGMGDAKLLAAAGAWVSWQGLPSIIVLAAGASLLVALVQAGLTRRSVMHQEFPFGPYLSLAFWLVWLYGPVSLA
jgi:leader peptidase (prepilin peptidase)/N-methyltransferase